METENYLTYFIILFISFLISSYKDSYIFIQWSLYKSKLEGKNTFLYEVIYKHLFFCLLNGIIILDYLFL